MNMYEKFEITLKSRTLFELADNLDLLISSFKNVESRKKQTLMSEFYHMLNARVFFFKNDSHIIVYNERESVPEYLYNYWSFMDSYRENVKQLQSVVSTIHNEILPPSTDGLSEQTLCDLFDLVDRKFQYGKNVLDGNPLRILQINNSHFKWNCYYIASIEEDTIVKDYVVMTCPQKPNTRQEFGFVHELGHRLHTSLTKKLFVPPASFACFGYIFDEDEKTNNAVMAENFADVFTIAALTGTPYEDCIPFEVHPENKLLFSLYIAITILTMNESMVTSIADLRSIAHKL
jgi:hypothetical protein